jgi:hypothetical protein
MTIALITLAVVLNALAIVLNALALLLANRQADSLCRRLVALESLEPPPLYWDGTPMAVGDRVVQGERRRIFCQGHHPWRQPSWPLLRTTTGGQSLASTMRQLQGRAVWRKEQGSMSPSHDIEPA